jgi:hypothetical protein
MLFRQCQRLLRYFHQSFYLYLLGVVGCVVCLQTDAVLVRNKSFAFTQWVACLLEIASDALICLISLVLPEVVVQ